MSFTVRNTQEFVQHTNEPWNPARLFSEGFCESMRTESIIFQCPMEEVLEAKECISNFRNEVYAAVTEGGIKFVAKPKAKGSHGECFALAEELAYKINSMCIAPYTNLHLIPPTVVRVMPDGRVASCQYYVETGKEEDLLAYWYWQKFFNEANPEHIKAMSVFHSVFGVWDKHYGNYLGTAQSKTMLPADIDNESMESRTFLPAWGERSFVQIASTRDQRANVLRQRVRLEQGTVEEFGEKAREFGFRYGDDFFASTMASMSQFRDSGRSEFMVDKGDLFVRFHETTDCMFPLPEGPYPEALVEAYRKLDEGLLHKLFAPLRALDSENYRYHVPEIMERRDLFLKAAADQ